MIKKQNGLYPCPECGVYPRRVYGKNEVLIECGCKSISGKTESEAEDNWNNICEEQLNENPKEYAKIVDTRYGIYDGSALFMIKPIEFKDSVVFNIPRLSANLPFGYSVTIRPFLNDKEGVITGHIWRIYQKTSKVIEGISKTSEQAVKDCQDAWIDIVRKALV